MELIRRLPGAKVRRLTCFGENECGFDQVKPINIVIGPNNSGKSHLIGFVQDLCEQNTGQLELSHILLITPEEAKQLNKNYRRIMSETVLYYTDPVTDEWPSPTGAISWGARVTMWPPELQVSASNQEPLRRLVTFYREQMKIDFSSMKVCRLGADRDIRPEKDEKEPVEIKHDGTGAALFLKRLLHNSDKIELGLQIQEKCLELLNRVFPKLQKFETITVKQHEQDETWEIYFRQQDKPLVPLSRSGSGLKTIILTALCLYAVPMNSRARASDYIFAFEELENNLHPALFKRLLIEIKKFVEEEQATLFLTTHSSSALDIFARDENSQILRISQDGKYSKIERVHLEEDLIATLNDLGVKPSDLLQANGVIWVEGPSDRVYINKWIALYIEKHGLAPVVEGRDYQCAFYGGALLGSNYFGPHDHMSDEERERLANLFKVNHNFLVVCDSDRKSSTAGLKPRVRQIQEQVAQFNTASLCLVTGTKEIENYLPAAALERFFGIQVSASPKQYESFFPARGERGRMRKSYLKAQCKYKKASVDKVQLAIQCTRGLEYDEIAGRFDWEELMKAIVDRIVAWGHHGS